MSQLDGAQVDGAQVDGAQVDGTSFRAAMARFAAGVTIVTTRDRQGIPRGYTASSFCSVSMEPPLILVCLARSADSYAAFQECERFAVSILKPEHTELAMRFAHKSHDKFGQGQLDRTANGIPVVDHALCILECTVHGRHEAGDHVIVIGRARRVGLGEGDPMIYFDRDFRQLERGTTVEYEGGRPR